MNQTGSQVLESYLFQDEVLHHNYFEYKDHPELVNLSTTYITYIWKPAY